MGAAGALAALIPTVKPCVMDKAFVEKVALMRKLQRDYFRDRDHMTLQACKKAEKEVDSLCAGFLNLDNKPSREDNHPKLF